jgi:hypothetical protein
MLLSEEAQALEPMRSQRHSRKVKTHGQGELKWEEEKEGEEERNVSQTRSRGK